MRQRVFLDPGEATALEGQIATLEVQTGVQLVAAVTGKADSYVELPWKAFALAAALAGLAVVVADRAWPDWPGSGDALAHVAVTLGAGAASALLSVIVPSYARVFLRSTRRDLEVRRYAQAFFLRRELFRTRRRNAVLILVSLFERKVDILPDVGLDAQFDGADWDRVVAGMTPLLRRRRCFDALQQGVAGVQAMLVAKGYSALPSADELPDRPVEEPGAR